MKDFILAVENVPKPMLIAEAVLIVLINRRGLRFGFFIIRSKPAYLKKLPRQHMMRRQYTYYLIVIKQQIRLRECFIWR